VFFSLILLRRINFLQEAFKKSSLICITGIFWALGVALMFLSYNMTLAAYAGSAMQLGTVFSIAIGALFFKEKAFKQRMIAGVLMVVGVGMMVLLH
jgi:glucose uptake protein GlcU